MEDLKKFLKNNNQVLAVLLIWFFFHFVILVSAQDGGKDINGYFIEATKVFYPFSDLYLLESYDTSEFLVYGIGPLVIFLAMKMIGNDKV